MYIIQVCVACRERCLVNQIRNWPSSELVFIPQLDVVGVAHLAAEGGLFQGIQTPSTVGNEVVDRARVRNLAKELSVLLLVCVR